MQAAEDQEPMYRLLKPILDFLLAALLLLALLPLLLPIAIALRVTGEGYIWYFQERVGYRNKIFKIWKFATMLLESPNMDGGIITTRNDPRITPLGGILRKTKVNELPQIINILVGDMSFVGPRPVMQNSFIHYPEPVQNVIYSVKPGLTGVGSIVFRDEEELIGAAKARGEDAWKLYTDEIYPYKGELEYWYQNNQSFTLDMTILLCTFWVVLFPKSNILFTLYPSIPKQSVGIATRNP